MFVSHWFRSSYFISNAISLKTTLILNWLKRGFEVRLKSIKQLFGKFFKTSKQIQKKILSPSQISIAMIPSLRPSVMSHDKFSNSKCNLLENFCTFSDNFWVYYFCLASWKKMLKQKFTLSSLHTISMIARLILLVTVFKCNLLKIAEDLAWLKNGVVR